MFRYAVASGLAETDPTYALRDVLVRPTRKHRSAITDPKALGQLMLAIDAFEGQATTRIGLKLLAITAQRPGEIRHAKWEEFDFAGKVWSLPAAKMKMRRDHNVPLPDQALALLDELRMITGNGEYLFPSLHFLALVFLHRLHKPSARKFFLTLKPSTMNPALLMRMIITWSRSRMAPLIWTPR